MATIKDLIIKEVKIVTSSKSFKDWLSAEKIAKSGQPILVINNSFIFREGIKTNKNSKYIAVEIDAKGKFDVKTIFIIEGMTINSPFKIIVENPTTQKTSIDNAIKNELKEIGEIIFTLIGEIKDVHKISESIQTTTLKKLILDPTQSQPFSFLNDEVVINDCSDKEKIWKSIEEEFNNNGLAIVDNLSFLIDKAVSDLQHKAFSTLEIPKSINKNKMYLLDQISKVIDEHLQAYREHVKKINEPSSQNEILRISYNFVSDVNKLLVLIINICDLKPIIHWLTISKHYELDQKFKELPFGLSHSKPSLLNYESVIKNARNKSFHQLFPFNKSLHLEIAALNKVSLRMFSSYSKKSENKMTFKDQELYEILMGFTRVTEQYVSNNFWVKNEGVMEAIYTLINSTSSALKESIKAK